MSLEQAGTARRIVSLGMYADPPPLREGTRRLWAHVRNTLRRGGLKNAPDAADEAMPLDEAWLSPDLLLAQTCGYPFVQRLKGKVRLVATPCYDHPGCSGPIGGSFIVVRVNDTSASIADLAGRRAAINSTTSNSGYNLLRASVAPHAGGRPFFSEVVETGGHGASIAAVAGGAADVAAIDCVTWGNVQRYAPERIAGLRILKETVKTPGLPLITRITATDAELSMLRSALDSAAADPAMAETCATLGLRGFALLTEADYQAVSAIERDAIALGYPEVA